MRVESASPHPQKYWLARTGNPGSGQDVAPVSCPQPGCGTCLLSPAIPGFLLLFDGVDFPQQCHEHTGTQDVPGMWIQAQAPLGALTPKGSSVLGAKPRGWAQPTSSHAPSGNTCLGKDPPGSSSSSRLILAPDSGSCLGPGGCLSPDGVKRLRNLGCASSPSLGASAQPCPRAQQLLSFPVGAPVQLPAQLQHMNPHPPGERGCFWPGRRNVNTSNFPGNLLQFLPARQRGPVMQLSSEPHDLPAPSRAGCCGGVICGGVLWPPLGELGRVTVLLLQLHKGTRQT